MKSKHVERLALGISVAPIDPMFVGVGSGKEQIMEFTYYSAAAGNMSSCCILLKLLHFLAADTIMHVLSAHGAKQFYHAQPEMVP